MEHLVTLQTKSEQELIIQYNSYLHWYVELEKALIRYKKMLSMGEASLQQLSLRIDSLNDDQYVCIKQYDTYKLTTQSRIDALNAGIEKLTNILPSLTRIGASHCIIDISNMRSELSQCFKFRDFDEWHDNQIHESLVQYNVMEQNNHIIELNIKDIERYLTKLDIAV